MNTTLLIFALLGQNVFLPIDEQPKGTRLYAQSEVQDVPKEYVKKPLDAVYKLMLDGKFAATAISIGDSRFLTASHTFRDLSPRAEIAIRKDGKNLPCAIIKKHKFYDYAVIELLEPQDILGINLDKHIQTLKPGQKVQSIGTNEKGDYVTVTHHTITAVQNDLITTDGFVNLGRSGGGLFDGDRLIGVLNARNLELTEAYYCPLSVMDFKIKQYRGTFYSSKSCTFCKQQHAITDTKNDKRFIPIWSEDPIPAEVKLTKGYNYPVLVVIKDGTLVWPATSGVMTIDQIVQFCEDNGSEEIQEEPLGYGARKAGPVGALACSQEVENLFAAWNKYIGDHQVSGAWHRTGKQLFRIYPNEEKYDWLDIFGKMGHFSFDCDSESLPTNHLGFTYKLDDSGSVTFDLDPITIKGIVEEYNRRTNPKVASVDPMTLYMILNSIRYIWMLLHPVADVFIGGDISLKAQMVDDAIRIKFEQMPELRAVWIFSFKLGVKEVELTRKHLKFFFTGSRWVKEYTFNIE